MKKNLSIMTIIFTILFFAVSCGGNDDENYTGNDENSTTDNSSETLDDVVNDDKEVTDENEVTDDNEVSDDSNVDNEVTDKEETDNETNDESEEPQAECREIAGDFHAGASYVVFNTFSMETAEPDSYDLSITKYDSGPAYFLGVNSTSGTMVSGIDLGNETSFSDVTTAPDDGYLADDLDNMNLVIGSGWRVPGGTGSVGFEMTNNVYVIKTCDGKYAKVIFTEGKSGSLKLNVCYQADGSKNISGDIE